MAILSLMVGLIAGLVAVLLKNLVFAIQWGINETAKWSGQDWFKVITPLLGLMITALLINKWIKEHPGPGIPVVLQAISKRRSTLKRKQIYAAFFTSATTVGFGGSAGLEAPTVQTSAAIASNLGLSLNLNYKTKTLLLACAAAGSMAAIFKAPIAAIVFAVEVIMIDLTAGSLVPLLLASIAAFLTTHLMLGEGQIIEFDERASFDVKHLHHYIILGVTSAFVSIYFSRIYLFILAKFRGLRNNARRITFAGGLLALILFLVPSIYGEGYKTINAFLDNDLSGLSSSVWVNGILENPWVLVLLLFFILLLKGIATGITMGAGGVGGVFAPALFMGSTLGMLYSKVWGLFSNGETPTSNLVLVGMAGLVSGVIRAPLTAIFLIAELSGGYGLFVPLMITSGLAFYIARGIDKHNIYTNELAQRGELITHDKDQAVLTLMKLQEQIEKDFSLVKADASMRDLVQLIAKSKRNIFPVLSPDERLLGIILLDDVREAMFDQSCYDNTPAVRFMTEAPETIELIEGMESVMAKFDASGAWNLPVLDGGKYIGFVSKSKLFSAYRAWLQEVNSEATGMN
ncbi:MAG: chloride channel protein [Flavobacteriales bacterium]|nr:chloride channel protein [Flavobacteriales bacterium]MDG1767351.1 chloride channel protein [Flavobacteriales bacterium]